MTSVLDKQVICLNRLWQVIGETSVRQAIGQLCAGAAVAIYVNGTDKIPMTWDEWCTLPPNEDDGVIRSQHLRVRRPTVIAMCVYSKMKLRKPKKNLKTLAALANYTDEYTGKKLHDKRTWSKDHITPRCQGGADEPENWAFTHKDHNSDKGGRTPEQAGLPRPKGHKLRPMPPGSLVVPSHPDHTHFLIR